ncbi:MAG: hypothetical protein GF411_14685 [Candidatus Lokiarchaeota archaeon]|nr:hypothetical protein [Candidatus Lokiarchaeota archaeon]
MSEWKEITYEDIINCLEAGDEVEAAILNDWKPIELSGDFFVWKGMNTKVPFVKNLSFRTRKTAKRSYARLKINWDGGIGAIEDPVDKEFHSIDIVDKFQSFRGFIYDYEWLSDEDRNSPRPYNIMWYIDNMLCACGYDGREPVRPTDVLWMLTEAEENKEVCSRCGGVHNNSCPDPR